VHTVFTSNEHGYQFRNAFEGAWPELCGGMAFSSLDYYYAGLTIPRVVTAPEPDEPLYGYLMRRQLDAHAFAIPALVAGRSRWGTNSRRTSETHAYDAVKNWINRGSPMPILLGDLENPLSTNSHWVVGTGYEDGNGGMGRVYLYDNNYPNRRCWISPSDSGSVSHFAHSENRRYGFYVPYLDYRPQDPRGFSAPTWFVGGSGSDGI
jgi:hypothetical protein